MDLTEEELQVKNVINEEKVNQLQLQLNIQLISFLWTQSHYFKFHKFSIFVEEEHLLTYNFSQFAHYLLSRTHINQNARIYK